MKNHVNALKWATDYLIAEGYILQHSPEIVVETPWSIVTRLPTLKEDVYLKQTSPALFLEPKIMQLLVNPLHASVPFVIESNDNLHCFLMKDAGQNLRKFLKKEFQSDLLYRAIKNYTNIQRSAENHIKSFFALGVPDWRLDKLPSLYDQLIKQVELLKAEGVTDDEIQTLRNLNPKILEQCELLSQYQIPETLVQPDFNTNNTLFDPILKKMTLIDLGEIAITHPFFSLHNFLLQATIHHGVKELDQTYHQLINVYFEDWLELKTKNQLLDAFALAKKLWPIYSALAHYRLMMSVDLQAFKSYCANKPNRLAGDFREYITANK